MTNPADPLSIEETALPEKAQENPALDRLIQRMKLTQKLIDAGLSITDWNGHLKRGEAWAKGWHPEQRLTRILRNLGFPCPGASDEEIDSLEAALAGGAALETPLLFGSCYDFKCPYCDERLEIATDGKQLKIIGEPCALPDGIAYHDIELNVPSGRFVVDDDLRNWYPLESDRDINWLRGKIQMTDDYAEIGLAMGFVGNSSPSLMRVKGAKDKYVIANYSATIYDEKADRERKNPKKNPWGKKLASIYTDLWWYSIADGDDFAKRLAHYTPGTDLHKWEHESQGSWTHTTVKVRPGVYRFRWFPEEGDEGSCLYAEIEWLREPDPVVELLSLDLDEKLTALECCIQECLDTPSLYFPNRPGNSKGHLSWEELSEGQKLRAIARSADRFMCILGGGTVWHENGHVRKKITQNARDFASAIDKRGVVPFFSEECHWYPFSEGYGGLCLGAGINKPSQEGGKPEIRLNESFALLALNITQNFIQHPPKPHLNRDMYPPRFNLKEVRNRMLLALKCYRGIRQNYSVAPMDPVFDDFALSGEAPLEILARDLGPDHPPEGEWGALPPILKLRENKFVEFDAGLIPRSNRTCWHPSRGGCWASPEVAQRYAILHAPPGAEDAFHANAGNSVPLKFVARIVSEGETHMGPHLVVEFDYGHDKMTGAGAHLWAVANTEAPALRAFDDEEEYKRLLPEMEGIYIEMEKSFPPKKA